ncbi:MAG: universal stress protein [Phycisphaerales bacterium JB040]
MRAVKTVLVATDFSPASHTAMRQASRLCGKLGAALHVVHVLPAEGVKEIRGLIPDSADDIQSQIVRVAEERLSDEVRTAGVHAASTRVSLGSAVAGIMRAVEDVRADLLVIGSHGTGGRRFGTIASRCMHKSPVSVMMVPENQGDAFSRLVVGIDFSEGSGAVLEHAVGIASLDGASIVAANVYDLPWDTGWGAAPPNNARQLEEALHASLKAQFEAILPDGAKGLSVSFETVSGVDYGAEIAGFAARQRADLVVVGMTGRSALGYFLLGSTAEKTMRDTTCAVLAVKGSG